MEGDGASASYQLPLLTRFIRPFELHVNPRYASIEDASRSSNLAHSLVFQDDESSASIQNNEQHELAGARIGLLAALAYPRVDLSQLRLAADLLSLLVVDHWRVQFASLSDERSQQFSDVMNRMHPRPPPAFWRAHQAFKTAHRASRTTAAFNFETYVDVRREIRGLAMALALVDEAQILDSHPDQHVQLHLQKATDAVVQIVTVSWDILSYSSKPSDQSNLVSVIAADKNYDVQSSLNAAGALVRQAVDSFLAAEATLTACLDRPHSNSSLCSRITALCLKPEAQRDSDTVRRDNDVRTYLRGLRDWIAAGVEWGYASELWLGKRGEEVREFGWIFT